MFKKTIVAMVVLLVGVFVFGDGIAEAGVSPSASYIYAKTKHVDVDQEVEISFGLLDADGKKVKNHDGYKVYVWAENLDGTAHQISDAFYELKDPSNLMSPISQPGVLMAKGAELDDEEVSFIAGFKRSGKYVVRAIYMPTTIDFKPTGVVSDYAAYEISGQTAGDSEVQINEEDKEIKQADVLIKAGSKIITEKADVESGDVILTKKIPVNGNGVSTTEVKMLFRDKNGNAAGKGQTVYITPRSNKVQSDQEKIVIDYKNSIVFKLTGTATGDYQLDISFHKPATPPTPPVNKGQKVLVPINANYLEVNDSRINIDENAVVKNNRTFIPLRAVGEALKAQVSYDHITRIVKIKNSSNELVLKLGSNTYQKNGSAMSLDAPIYLSDKGRTMVPLRFVGEGLGAKITVNANKDGVTESVLLTMQ